MCRFDRSQQGFTLREALTALVVLAVLVAVSVPLARNHELRAQRHEAIDALLAAQSAQDRFFGKHARYADATQLSASEPDGLGLNAGSAHGAYRLTLLTNGDGLGYWAVAHRVSPADRADSRCVEMRIDQNGRRFAVDADGADRSADCWR